MGSSQEAVRLPKQEIAAFGAVAQNNSDESLVMEGLVGKCPTAIVKLAGVPVTVGRQVRSIAQSG